MTLKEIAEKLNWEVVCGEELLNKNVSGGYCSDLLSDVMGNAQEDQIWLTIQVHKNIIAVAALKDLAAILLVKGLNATDDAIEAAKEEGIPVLKTSEPAFETAGKIYNLINA